MADIRQPEFRIHFSSSVNKASQESMPEIVISTVREFTSVGYGINVEWNFDEGTHSLSIEIGGLTVSGVERADPGPARTTLRPALPNTGTIAVVVTRKTEAAACTVTYEEGRPLRIEGVQEGGLAVFTMERSSL